MLMIARTVRDIKSLKIQGATNIAIAAAAALKSLSTKKYYSTAAFKSDLSKAVFDLVSARPTEPALRNAIRFVIKLRESSVPEMQYALSKNVDAFIRKQHETKQKTVVNLANSVKPGSTIFTHCHSSTVTAGLILASKTKKFKVICTETRPRFQGRITAQELTSAGIDTTMIVDSAASSFLKGCSRVYVGCDAIEYDGQIINKIGTLTIALLAKRFRVPFTVVTESYKFDPETKKKPEPIERRSPDEIWESKVKILNPAFDRTSPEFVASTITEFGELSVEKLLPKLKRMYK